MSFANKISDSDSVLLLGMVYAHQATEPRRGQEFRDRVRCEALQAHGFNIYTLDDKHDDSVIEEHCRANFADTRRMLNSISSKWNKDVGFNHIILDYFFSPVGWARERWNVKFFSTTLPAFASSNRLRSGGKIWLPNLDCIEEQLKEYNDVLSKYYKIYLVSNSLENPLYKATEDCEKELLRCPDILTNTTQIQPLLNYSDSPFFVLELKDDIKETPSTPKTTRASKRTIDSLDTDSSISSGPIKKEYKRRNHRAPLL